MADEKVRLELLKDLGLDNDSNWQDATLEELVNYRMEVPFYHFWYWEYQKRNPEYQEEYYSRVKPQSIEDRFLNALGDRIEKSNKIIFDYLTNKLRDDHQLCDPQIGPTSSEILQSLADGTFERKEPIPFFWTADIGLAGYKIEYRWVYNEFIKSAQIEFSCDPRADPKLISDHMQKILKWAKENTDKANELFFKQYDGKYVTQYMDHIKEIANEENLSRSEAMQKIDAKYPEWRKEWMFLYSKKTLRDIRFLQPPANGKKRFTETDIPRAIGIWLWDYWQENNCYKSEAIEKFLESFDTKALDLEEKIPNKYYNYLNITDRCIKECEVLPL